jgi:hypothetical protein
MAPMQTRRRSCPTDVRALVVLFAATGLLAACTGAASPATAPTTSNPSPSTSTPAQTLAAVTPTPSATLAAVTPTPSATLAAVTLTPGAATVVTVAWGKIWVQVPSSFPLPSDAEPAQPADPVEGPSSGVFTTSLGVDKAAQGIEAGLTAAGWSLGAMTSGEDGSRDISAVGASPGCRSRVIVRPLGSVHFVTVYYGAGCPRP